jgi:putative ABC transport system permease protein
MPFGEAVRLALASLRAHKLRSFLTVLGILIGVSSVVAVVAIINGLDRYVGERVLELGSRSFSLQRIPAVVMSADLWVAAQRRRWITLQDMEAIRRSCADCMEVGAQSSINLSVKYGRTVQENVQLIGITENITRIGSVRDLAAGRHLLQDDIDRARPVAVIGMDLVDAFFGSMEPVGKTISVSGFPLKVVGVAERKGSVFGNSQDNFIWVPISLFFRMQGRRSIVIQAEARSMEVFETAQDQARVALRARRHLSYLQPDDFALETGESVLSLWQAATAGIYAATILVTAISLVVGGIVVMNIMLVSVTERTAEIGMRKALGARRRDILRQFLVEAVVLSLFGGFLGVLGASLFAILLGKIIGGIMSADFVAPIRGWAVLLALVFSSLVGLAAGLYPARRAARLDPVAALRSE